MTTTKGDKRAPPDLERAIDSERYKITEFLGRGCWGSVFAARDTILDREVAIKILDPTDIAKRQMQERNLDQLAAMKNEALEMQACANIVPRAFEVDRRGVPFIVMPKYETFFSDVIANPPNKGMTRWGATFGDETPLETGFFISDIIKISEDIINGLAEIHDIYGKAHCDIKPDNLAVDKNGKILISDMGTSTFASFGMSASPRDNMGYAYTRSPRLFIEGSHPKKSSDVFAFGSILYRMFTGEYIFEKEIDEAAVKGGEDSVKSFMKSLKDNSFEFDKKIEKKLGNSKIPDEFKGLIKNCIEENINDGKYLKTRFEDTVKKYLENRIKRSEFDKFKKKARSGFINGIITGTVLAGLGLGIGWLTYFAPKPDHSNKADLETQISVRELNKSETILKVECAYENIYSGRPEIGPIFQEGRYFFEKKPNEKTLIDHIITAWFKTANEMPENDFRGTDYAAFPHEWRGRLFGMKRVSGSPHLSFDGMLNELLPTYFILNQTQENVVDLEDALTATLMGTQKLREAQKSVNSCDFDKYITARDAKGQYIIPEVKQRFLRQLLYNITQALPLKVRLE
jgi:serine/threonine protein kinase